MKHMFALLLALALCLSAALADMTLTVNGTAVITAEPDQLTINVSAQVQRPTAMEAQAEIAAIVNTMRASLAELGLDEEHVVTNNYSFFPNYDFESGHAVLNGYMAEHALSIVLQDLGMLNQVLTVITESGVSAVNSIEYGVSTSNVVYREALCEAINAATAKARQMAGACGYTADQVSLTSVKEQVNSYGVVYATNMLREEAAADKALSTGINGGSIRISATVEAVFEAK